MFQATAKLVLAATLWLGAGAVWATVIQVEQAVEAQALELRLDEDLSGTVAGKQCDDCERQRFRVTAETQAIENGVRIDLRQALGRVGKPATIIYNIRTRDATKIIWWR